MSIENEILGSMPTKANIIIEDVFQTLFRMLSGMLRRAKGL